MLALTVPPVRSIVPVGLFPVPLTLYQPSVTSARLPAPLMPAMVSVPGCPLNETTLALGLATLPPTFPVATYRLATSKTLDAPRFKVA